MVLGTDPVNFAREAAHVRRGQKASCRLNVVIIGCGLGGIAAAHSISEAGHNVTILEAAREIREVGVGVVLPPSITRLLSRWGAGDTLRRVGVLTAGITPLRGTDGETMAYLPLGEEAEKVYGAPNMFIHRADFHKILSDLALSSSSVKLRLGARVSSVNPFPNSCGQVSVTLATGETVSGDLVIGADGVRSLTRSTVVGHPDLPEPSGDAVYRVTVPAEKLLNDPELRGLIESRDLITWVGKNTRLVAYPISSGRLYNLVFIHSDKGMQAHVEEGDLKELREQYIEFEPRVQKLISLVENPIRWRLMDRKPMESWVHTSGRVALLGDSCHPMLPYLAQGASMAVEDAAALGNILSRISSVSQLPVFLRAYEHLRKPRATEMQLGSRALQYLHNPPSGDRKQDGEEQAKTSLEGAGLSPSVAQEVSNKLSTDQESNGTGLHMPPKSKYAEWFSYDVDAAVDSWWDERRIPVKTTRLVALL